LGRRGWYRFRGYVDRLEEAMRLWGEQLAESERLLAHDWERSHWRAGQRAAVEDEVLRRALDVIGGLYELARLGWLTRFRFRGPYWRWRLHTAFGRGYPASKIELLRNTLRYGVWMRRMRRGMRRP